MKLKELQALYSKCVASMQTLIDGADDGTLTDEQQTDFDTLKAESESLLVKITNAETLVKATAEADRFTKTNDIPLDRQIADPTGVLDSPIPKAAPSAIVIPTSYSRMAGDLTSFAGPDAELRAYKAGMWFRAIAGNQAAALWCKEHGMPIEFTNLHQEGVNTEGGYLVPAELDRDIIRLVESFGIARQKSRRSPMLSDKKTRPRRTGGLTGYYPGEGGTATESTMSWDRITLIARLLVVLTKITNELNSDAIISVTNELVREIALTFANEEDEAGFNGTGASTYGGIVGIIPRLATINGVDDGGGIVLSANNTYGEITLKELSKVVSISPNLAGLQPEWYVNKLVWAQTMMTLEQAAGGNTIQMIKDGAGRLLHQGYPVNFVNVMPKVEANSQIIALFGDMRLSTDFGDRQGMTIAFSEHATVGDTSVFTTNELAVRGTERYDIKNHDLGSATVAGPMVGLMLKAS